MRTTNTKYITIIIGTKFANILLSDVCNEDIMIKFSIVFIVL